MVKREKLKGIEFSEKSYKFRKFLSVILFLAMLLGWTFLIGYNIYFAFATAEIRVHPQEMSGSYDPTNITLGGIIVVENDHWNSIAIRDLNISFTMYTDNDTKIIDDEKIQDVPSGTNTTLNLTFQIFNASMTPSEYLALYMAINSTEYIRFDLSISLKYGLYAVYFDVSVQSEFGGLI